MSETMIDRVARAIAAAEGYDVDGLRAYAASSSLAKEDYARLQMKARAAIEAMREPTLDMLKASDNLILNDEEFHAGPYELTKAEWRAMIDAALKEQTK